MGCIGDDLGCVGDEFGDDLGNLSDDLGSFDNALWIVPGVTARFDSLIIRPESEDILKFSTYYLEHRRCIASSRPSLLHLTYSHYQTSKKTELPTFGDRTSTFIGEIFGTLKRI